MKIRENKGRISTNFALITFAQYCIVDIRLKSIDLLIFYQKIDDRNVTVRAAERRQVNYPAFTGFSYHKKKKKNVKEAGGGHSVEVEVEFFFIF